jgi:hypothetical protein
LHSPIALGARRRRPICASTSDRSWRKARLPRSYALAPRPTGPRDHGARAGVSPNAETSVCATRTPASGLRRTGRSCGHQTSSPCASNNDGNCMGAGFRNVS